MAEVDGNRTRRTRITRPNRFEGGGAHQVLVHLRDGSLTLSPAVGDNARFPGPQTRAAQTGYRSESELPLDSE